jgi:tetratricopeptide (TPR) repeat protein
MRSWNLEGQATVALFAEDPAPAVEIRRQQLALARSIGYERVEAIAARGLASILIQLGETDEPLRLLHRALELVERASVLTDQALVLMEFANLAARHGDREEAVAILTAVQSHKASERMDPLQGTLLGDMAAESLSELAQEMEPAVYETAREAGSMKGFDIVIKELLARSPQ